MTFDLMKRRISLLFAAAVVLSAVTLPAVTYAQQRIEFAATPLGEQDAPDRTRFCSKQHVQRRIGLPVSSRFQQGYPVYAALLIVNGRNGSGMPQSYAAEFYSHLSWDILQIVSQMRKYLPQQGGFRISDYIVIQCDPIEFPNMPLFDELVEQRRSSFGFGSSPAPRPKMVYYPLKACHDDQICEQIQQDFVTRPAPQAQVPPVHLAVRDPKTRPPSAEPPRAASVPERNYPNPDYPLLPPAAEIRPGQSVVAYENATCSNQGNWLLTFQGTVVSTSQEEVQVFVNKRTGLYNYVGEPGPAGEKEKIWDKGYLCAPRREICFGDVDFEAWNGQITKGSPVPFPRDSIGVVDDVTKDPVPVFKHFLTRACGAGPASAVTAGPENPTPGAETAPASEAPATKPAATAPVPAMRPPGRRGL